MTARRFDRQRWLVDCKSLSVLSFIPPLARGEGLLARAIRSSAWTIFGYGTSQAVRLGANLILTRLLFPEAFGLMALIGVIITGLALFSDFGIGPSIMQNKRGDEPAFLNTAWTIQILRGAVLYLGCCALAWPAAVFYGEPTLAHFLSIASLSLLIGGFLRPNSTPLIAI